MNSRVLFLILAVALVLAGVFMPTGWYDDLPTNERYPEAPFRGVILLQASLMVEALVFLWLSYRRWTFVRIAEDERLEPVPEREAATPNDRTTLWILGGITTLALVLRLYGINSDLWLDEILTIQDYVHLSPLAVIGTFLSSNNHLLNTLLVQLSTTLFGEAEWSVRLPAVLFGVASIPAIYWVARLALTRWESLGAAALLAVSYHHIFFSQNARGYSAYIFFSLLASRLLIDALQQDRLRLWLLYGLSMFLSFAALLNTAFVFLAHVLIGAVALWLLRRRGASPLPMLRRLVVVFAATGFLVFQLYATVLPTVYVFMNVAYVSQGSGFSLANGEFFKELFRGLSQGFGPGLLVGAVPFLVLVGFGFLNLWRRHWMLALVLVLPLALTAAFLILKGLTFSPRFFIFGLPLAMIAAIPSIRVLAEFTGRLLRKPELRSRFATGLVLVVALLSLTSLGYYYATPKQSYRAAFEHLKAGLAPDEIVVIILHAERGTRYYGARYGLEEGKNTFHVRSVKALDEVLTSHPGQPITLLTTFWRFLHYFDSDLEAQILAGWTPESNFPASIGDGQITIWKQNP